MQFQFNELVGDQISLLPMKSQHKAAIVEAAADGKLWELWFTSVPCKDTIDSYLEFALTQKKQNKQFPFVVVENQTGRVIGATRFCNIDCNNRRLEIGYTFYAKSFQKTLVNTQVKYLMLQYAFETLNVIAVEFRTHRLNLNSRTAIERIGAKYDGTLRNHIIMPNQTIRDSVVYSIIDSEWASVKSHLNYKLPNN